MSTMTRIRWVSQGHSLLEVMFGRSTKNLNDTVWAQPAIYALECAHTVLWENMGVVPDVVIGHSVGEFAAAHAAEVFGLEDGMRIMVKRSGILASLPEAGVMAALFAPLRSATIPWLRPRRLTKRSGKP